MNQTYGQGDLSATQTILGRRVLRPGLKPDRGTPVRRRRRANVSSGRQAATPGCSNNSPNGEPGRGRPDYRRQKHSHQWGATCSRPSGAAVGSAVERLVGRRIRRFVHAPQVFVLHPNARPPQPDGRRHNVTNFGTDGIESALAQATRGGRRRRCPRDPGRPRTTNQTSTSPSRA